MAGSYPDAPGRRIAYDADGTIVTNQVGATGQQTALTAGEVRALNSIDAAGYTVPRSASGWLRWFFPEPRDLSGVFAAAERADDTTELAVSADTTNGVDGVWTVTDPTLAQDHDVTPDFRTEISSLAVAGVRAVRMTWDTDRAVTGTYRTVHFYGRIAAGHTRHRLHFFDDVTDLEYVAPVDYGDTPRGAATDTAIYLRNGSGSRTAHDVTVTAESIFDSSGGWYTFSDGGPFTASLTLASAIGPGADSPTITVRRIIPDVETVGLHEGRLVAAVGSWS